MANKNKNKKKKPSAPQQQMSPTKYITSGRARLLPLHQCWISENWQEEGMCSIIVERQHSTGNITLGTYLIDLYCLGLKNTMAAFSKSAYEVQELKDNFEQAHGGMIEIDYVLAHNIIYGAIAYAEDLGFKPEKDWAVSQFILEEDTEDIELIDIVFGKNGKPLFVSGAYDNAGKIISKLEATTGKGNFDVIITSGGMGNFGGGNFFGGNDFDDEDDDFDDEDDTIEDVEYEEVKK